MAIATIGFTFGQETKQDKKDKDVKEQTNQEKIDKENLPESITSQFSSGEFQEWAMEDAYVVTSTPDGQQAAYMVTAKRENEEGDEEKLNLYFDRNGKMIKSVKHEKEPGIL